MLRWGRMEVVGQKMFVTPHFNGKKLGTVVCTVITVKVKRVKEETCGPSRPGQNTRPCLQNCQSKEG
jgi:hypothetical protein